MLDAICSFIRIFTGAQARFHSLEPATLDSSVQRVYFANHTSHADCLVILSVLPRKLRAMIRPVAAADYWTATPLRRWFSARVLDIVAIERERPTRANNPMTGILDALDRGSSLLIFPEGGRKDCDTISDFKCGLYHIARARPDIELVPAYIDSGNRILPRGEYIPLPIICSVQFGEPLKLLPGELKSDFLERARTALSRCAY